MPYSQPPSSVTNTLERMVPGFRNWWNGAVGRAYSQAGGFTVTSWWRSPGYNREVGGSDHSQHLIGAAIDVVPVNQRVYNALRGAGFRVVNEGDHLHAQVWPAGAARPVLRVLGWS